jgi:hypothetical protein
VFVVSACFSGCATSVLYCLMHRGIWKAAWSRARNLHRQVTLQAEIEKADHGGDTLYVELRFTTNV